MAPPAVDWNFIMLWRNKLCRLRVVTSCSCLDTDFCCHLYDEKLRKIKPTIRIFNIYRVNRRILNLVCTYITCAHKLCTEHCLKVGNYRTFRRAEILRLCMTDKFNKKSSSCKASRLALRHIQPPYQRVQEALSLPIKRKVIQAVTYF